MQTVQIEALTPFLLGRLRAGDDLLDGIFFRAREMIERPEVGSRAGAAERAWAANPEPIRADESYADWSRMLKPIPISRPRRRTHPTDLADLRASLRRPAFVSILRLLKPPLDRIAVFGVGAGDPRPAARVEPGSLPRGRLAGVAALVSYWSAVRRFRAVLPRDVARAASESLRALSALWLAGLPEERTLDEDTAANLLRAARRAEIDDGLAERVFADQRDGRAPPLEDVAYLFARPSPTYARVFDRVVGRGARLELRDAYVRGGAFDALLDEPLDLDRPRAPVAVRIGAAAEPEGDRDIDVGLAPTVPLVVAAAIGGVPLATSRLRASLIVDDRIAAVEERAASEWRYFRWMLEARGGSYRIVAEALDEEGSIVASGSSGLLWVHQFAHCVRCPQRVDFGDAAAIARERECAWTASPRPGTAATFAESDDLEMASRYGESERVRAGAREAWLAGRARGRFVVPGRPAAPPIEYLGAHSPDRRRPDLPRIADTGEFARGSLVAGRADEMRALEAAAANRDENRETRDRAVAELRRMLEGRDVEGEDPRDAAKARRAAANRLEGALRDAVAKFQAIATLRTPAEAGSVQAAVTRLDKATEAFGVDLEIEADVETLFGRRVELREEYLEAVAAAKVAAERANAAAIDVEIRLRQARAFVGSEEFPTLLEAVRDAEEIEEAVAQMRNTIDEVRRGTKDADRAPDEAFASMERALAIFGAKRRAEVAAEAWNAKARGILADAESISLASDFRTELADALTGRPTEISNAIEAEAIATAMANIDYATVLGRVRNIRAKIRRVANEPPARVDPDLVGSVATALAETEKKLESWTREADEKAAMIEGWKQVSRYFAELAEFAPKANLEALILKQIAEAERPDDRAAQLGVAWATVAKARRALERLAANTRLIAEDAGAEITKLPPPVAGDFGETLEAAMAARRARIEAEKRRELESADEARARRAAEFEADPKIAKFDELAARVAEAEAKLRPGKATSIDDIAEIDSDLRALEGIAMPSPAGASAAEAADLAESRRERLEELRRDLLGRDEMRTALAADLVASRTFETFAQRSGDAAEIALKTRLALIDRSLGLLRRAAPYFDASGLIEGFETRRATVKRNGSVTVARFRVTDLAIELTNAIGDANAEFAREPEAPEDLEAAVADVIDARKRRDDAAELLRDADERLREANGEYLREYSTDTKAPDIADITAEVSGLFADYVAATDESFARRRDAALAKLIAAENLDLALRLVSTLEAERVEGANKAADALRRRSLGSAQEIRELAEALEVPTANALLLDRAAATVALAKIASLRQMPGADAEEARAALDEVEERAREALKPARVESMRAIASAFTFAKYGGDSGDSATRARDFLARDRDLYGDFIGEVVIVGGYAFDIDMLDGDAIERLLAEHRNSALTEARCGLDAHVAPGALTCALDSIVMLAAKADPQIMGRMLGTRSSECARDFSLALRRIDLELEQGRAPRDTCDSLRRTLTNCEARDERLRQILFEESDRARPKDTLDVADVLSWLNAAYAIEPIGLISEGVTIPESTRDTMSGILREKRVAEDSIERTFRQIDAANNLEDKADILGAALIIAGVLPSKTIELLARFRANPIAPPPIATRFEHLWPYSFSIDLFEGVDALHEVAVEDPVEAPRSFAIHPIDRAGALATAIRTGSKKIALRFARWGYSYDLVAIVHWRPGHYWITLRCGAPWYRFDSTHAPVFRRLVGSDPRDAETLGSMQILFYARGARTAPAPGEVENV